MIWCNYDWMWFITLNHYHNVFYHQINTDEFIKLIRITFNHYNERTNRTGWLIEWLLEKCNVFKFDNLKERNAREFPRNSNGSICRRATYFGPNAPKDRSLESKSITTSKMEPSFPSRLLAHFSKTPWLRIKVSRVGRGRNGSPTSLGIATV